MKKVKYRLYLDYEKEEKWINEMSAQGWHLEKFSFGRFVFTKGEPGEYHYRNEFLGEMNAQEKQEYFEFLKESGISVVHEFGGWIYMKRLAAEGEFHLYSDKTSHIAYYNRMLRFFIPLYLINLFVGLVNILNYTTGDYGLGYLNLAVGWLCIAVTFLMLYPVIKIIRRKKELERQQQFFE